ncbi:MAG TPA: MerR family transcriptional regulator [Pseudonocardiaceae bacterium]|nr:MerR family transcriptional regulator [Pseudonocardiaceae bacterium]
MIEADGERRWSIGELAKASGVTVRALHHYDRIGLLTPEHRTSAGHRRYSGRDVRRLYRIRALCTLGLSLEDIADVLTDDLAGLRDLLAAQLTDVTTRAARLVEMRDRIGDLLQQIDANRLPDTAQFMTTLELMSVYETYFTQQQRDELAERRAGLDADAVKQEWTELVEQLLPHVTADTPVDDQQVVELVSTWDTLGARFHAPAPQGEQTAQAARRMWQENSAELGAALPWPAESMTALVAYVGRVRAAR